MNEYILFDLDQRMPLSIIRKIKHPKIKRMLIYNNSNNNPFDNTEGLIFISDHQIFYTFYTFNTHRPLNHFFEFRPEVQKMLSYNNSNTIEEIYIDINFYKPFDINITPTYQASNHE